MGVSTGLTGLDGRVRSATFTVVVRLAYRFLLVLIVAAVIGGPLVHLTQLPQLVPPMAMAGMPCDMAMPMADAGRGAPTAPCKGLTPECMKQMGCVANVALPIRLADSDTSFVFSPVTYWSPRSLMAGVARTPEPLPPRTA